MTNHTNKLNVQQSANLKNCKPDLFEKEDMGASEFGGSCSGHVPPVMEVPNKCQDTCSTVDATVAMLSNIQSASPPAKECSSPLVRPSLMRDSEKAAVALGGNNWVQLTPSPKLPPLGARDQEATGDEILSLYRPFFRQECATVIHSIRQYPLVVSVQEACGFLDTSKIEAEPSPQWDYTMESPCLKAGGSSNLDLAIEMEQGIGCTNLSNVEEEGEEGEWNTQSVGSSGFICKSTSVSCNPKDSDCIDCSPESSTEGKLNHMNIQRGKETGDCTIVLGNCLEEVGSARGQQTLCTSLVDGAGSSLIMSRLGAHSDPGRESFLRSVQSARNTYELQKGASDEPAAGPNLTVTFTSPVLAPKTTLEHGTEPGLERRESSDNACEYPVCVSMVDEKVPPVPPKGRLSETLYNQWVESGHPGGVSLWSLDDTLDMKGMFLVTSTPLIVPKSFNFAKIATPSACDLQTSSVVSSAGDSLNELSVGMKSSAGPSTESRVNLPPPSKLKTPNKVPPKLTTLRTRLGRGAHSSNTVSNKMSLLPHSNCKSVLPSLRGSAAPFRLPVTGSSSSGVSSLGQKVELPSKSMASTSSQEGKKLNAPAGSRILSSAISKAQMSSIPILSVQRSRLGVVGSSALKEKAANSPTSCQKQRHNTHDTWPMVKRKRTDTLGPSSMKVKGLAVMSTSAPTTRKISTQLRSRNTGASSLPEAFISRSSAVVGSSAVAELCDLVPKLSKTETPARSTAECKNCVLYQQEIERLQAELQNRMNINDRKGDEPGCSKKTVTQAMTGIY